jgi:hypothetical protein
MSTADNERATFAKAECGTYGVEFHRSSDSSVQPYITHRFNSKAAIDSGRYTAGRYWGHYYGKDQSAEAAFDFFVRLTDISRDQPTEDILWHEMTWGVTSAAKREASNRSAEDTPSIMEILDMITLAEDWMRANGDER